MNTNPPSLPTRTSQPMALVALLIGIIGTPVALFSASLCYLGRDGGYAGLFLVGLILLLLGILLQGASLLVSIVALIRERSLLAMISCGLNMILLPVLLSFLIFVCL